MWVMHLKKIKKVNFFTREGVLDFYETGHIIDGLSEHFLPVPHRIAEKKSSMKSWRIF